MKKVLPYPKDFLNVRNLIPQLEASEGRRVKANKAELASLQSETPLRTLHESKETALENQAEISDRQLFLQRVPEQRRSRGFQENLTKVVGGPSSKLMKEYADLLAASPEFDLEQELDEVKGILDVIQEDIQQIDKNREEIETKVKELDEKLAEIRVIVEEGRELKQALDESFDKKFRELQTRFNEITREYKQLSKEYKIQTKDEKKALTKSQREQQKRVDDFSSKRALLEQKKAASDDETAAKIDNVINIIDMGIVKAQESLDQVLAKLEEIEKQKPERICEIEQEFADIESQANTLHREKSPEILPRFNSLKDKFKKYKSA